MYQSTFFPLHIDVQFYGSLQVVIICRSAYYLAASDIASLGSDVVMLVEDDKGYAHFWYLNNVQYIY